MGNTISPRKKDVIADAQNAGFELVWGTSGKVCSVVRRHKGTGQVLVGVTLWEDGTLTRCDVDLPLATRLTIRDARRVLGLPETGGDTFDYRGTEPAGCRRKGEMR